MNLFKNIAQEFAAHDERRESMIKISRGILKEAKRVIFLCHENDLKAADRDLKTLTRIVEKAETQLQKKLSSGNEYALYSEGAWKVAIEEYLEAWFLLNFMTQSKLIMPKVLTPQVETVIGALSDFTGEISRLCVVRGADKDLKELRNYRDIVAEVVKQLLSLHLTGHNRQKFDQAKRNLKRIEEIVYEVKIRI